MLHYPHERNGQPPQTPDYPIRRRLRRLAAADQRQRLLTAMVSLLPTEEVTQMVEQLLEASETLLLDTPYLRRMREKGVQIGREQGIQIGREQGVQIGLEKGQQIGREQGVQIGREQGIREAILEAVARRFNPPATDYRELQRRLESIHQPDQLQQVLLALFDAQNTAVILDLLHNLTNTPAHSGNGGQ